ncbi:MAG: hypothetical protein ACAI43_02490 [Phycisphaerae bacterium]|nr:hypothetical protein [Tepidisphaeraceae bacterium]
MRPTDLLQLLGVVVLVIVMGVVLRLRRRGKVMHDVTYATDEVCEHLKRPLDFLLAQGLGIAQVGQKAPEFPLEIHLTGPFDPHAVYKELELEPPVHVSERGVLICKDDWCEIHPRT